MNQVFTVKNAMDYLETTNFENAMFQGFIEELMYFTAIDEDGQEKEIEFEENENGQVYVSVGEDGIFEIFAILED